MPILFTVDARSGVPIYVQLIDQVKRAVAVGSVRPGEQLPTVKSVALELTVNANTVLRAYRELEREQIVETTQGRGTFVRGNGSVEHAAGAVRALAAERFDAAAREARSLGLDRGDASALANESVERWYDGGARGEGEDKAL